MRRRLAFVTSSAALFVAASAFSEGLDAALTIGDPAPSIEVEVLKGEAVDIAAGRGEHVYVIEFWATWCPPCLKSAPHLSKLQAKLGDKGLKVIGISDEDKETVEPFIQDLGTKMDYTVAIDPSRRSHRRYMQPFGLTGIPHAFVVSKAGDLVWHGHPMDPFLEHLLAVLVEEEVKPATRTSSPIDTGESGK